MNKSATAYLKAGLLSVSALALCSCASLGGLGGIASSDVSDTVRASEIEIPDALPVVSDLDSGAIRADSFQSLFTDPILQDHFNAALAGNLDLETAVTRVEAAQARLTQARARRLPSLSVGANTGLVTGLNDIDPIDTASLSASLAFDPDVFGGLRASVRSSAARAAISEAELARLSRVILAQTAIAYIQAIEADLQLELARENFEFLGETLRVSRARFEGGDIARADFSLSEAEFENARANLASQEIGAREARRTLAALRGEFANADIAIASDLPIATARGAVISSSARAILSRNDVRAQRLAIEAAAADIDAVVASTRPGFSITAALSGGDDFSNLFDLDSYIARIAASVSDIVFDGGGEQARIEEVRTALDASVIAYERILRNSYADLTTATDQVGVFGVRLDALDRASAAAQDALELETIRYDLGESILLDVLTIQRRVNAIQADRIRTDSLYLQAIIAAHLAAGPT